MEENVVGLSRFNGFYGRKIVVRWSSQYRVFALTPDGYYWEQIQDYRNKWDFMGTVMMKVKKPLDWDDLKGN